MLRFVDLEDDQGSDDVLLAGLKPLPLSRMARQAGRIKNQARGGYNSGPMFFSRSAETTKRIKFSPEEVQTMLRSDPQFARSYQRQITEGKRDNQTDKYMLHKLPSGAVSGYQYAPWMEGNTPRRESIGTEALNRQTIERHRKNNQAIDNWDPIEASAQEDFNRMKGGRKGPELPDAAGFVMDIESIPTPSNPEGVRMFPGV